MMNRLTAWWRRPDQYDELSAHLHSRGVANLFRVTIAGATVSLALLSLATIPSATGPRGALEVSCALTASVGAVSCAALWVMRWPTRTQSRGYVVVAGASIALAVLGQSNPIAAILACTIFAALAAFIALMHSASLIGFNFALTVLVASFEALRVAAQFGSVSAICAYVVALWANFAVPFGIQTVGHVLGVDAMVSERDQLTGLLTRRGFDRRAGACLESGRQQQTHVVVCVIDLDRFKQLNDRYGHSTGDDALSSVARALRDTSSDTAVIGRSGGEEFVIADQWHPDDVDQRAQQLCEVIAALPFAITASIGTAGTRPAHRNAMLSELTAAADAAMYVAKRRGGNQVSHHSWDHASAVEHADNDVTDPNEGSCADLAAPASTMYEPPTSAAETDAI